jgi:hypothetical protein
MRRYLWLVALLFGVMVVPNAHADGFDASFDCTTSCSSVPTDPYVLFPSPTIPITFDFKRFDITLSGLDSVTDDFKWGVGSNSDGWYFFINDLTKNTFDSGPTWGFDGSNHYGSGCVYFTNVPEPSSLALLLLGIVTLFVVRKRIGRGLPQAR